MAIVSLDPVINIDPVIDPPPDEPTIGQRLTDAVTTLMKVPIGELTWIELDLITRYVQYLQPSVVEWSKAAPDWRQKIIGPALDQLEALAARFPKV